ncbi:hypothetical protein [Rhodococcus spongiicola]|uniref:Uncharacterized protein n=1 Tax=Rhodococcus spongiicola TaxID=2487352 RepID=A0A3S3E608_9NOCA|nr:hypothetical protein [Rhodococcus spongiicola]RVW06146.1 hypothetical protein EF834_01405 [Rhodococcus spongiicola]
MKRLGFVVAGVLLAVGMGTISAPTATAEELGFGMSTYEPCSDRFRLPWEPVPQWAPPAPWDPALYKPNVVLSPFGTADIYCAAWKGFSSAYQVDPWGNRHTLDNQLGQMGSAASVSNVPFLTWATLPFYVWDPETF